MCIEHGAVISPSCFTIIFCGQLHTAAPSLTTYCMVRSAFNLVIPDYTATCGGVRVSITMYRPVSGARLQRLLSPLLCSARDSDCLLSSVLTQFQSHPATTHRAATANRKRSNISISATHSSTSLAARMNSMLGCQPSLPIPIGSTLGGNISTCTADTTNP